MAALNPSLEDLAECHFVTNFDLLPTQGTARGSMDYLLPILKREALHQDFRHAFRACALALFNNRLQSQRRPCARSALLEYTQALQKTNRALRDPDTQRKDTTLAAVLLLALFETLTKTNIEAWGAHIDGAIQLVQLRGKGQLNTEIGVLLFTSVRTQMVRTRSTRRVDSKAYIGTQIIYSLTCAKPPDVSIDWWTDRSVHNTYAAQCQRIIVATAELRAAITRLVGSTSPTPEHNGIMDRMVRACEAVDNEAVRWMKQVPEAWRYHTVAWEDHMPEGADDLAATPVYPGRVDVYADHYVASLWNMARTARLTLASGMVRSAAWRCRPLDVRTTPEYAVASRRCTETIAAILASVPFHLGGHAGQAGYAQGWSGGGDRSSPKCLAGYFLIWPLSCARSQDYATDNQRAWIQGRLRFIGDNLGVKHAHTLADVGPPRPPNPTQPNPTHTRARILHVGARQSKFTPANSDGRMSCS